MKLSCTREMREFVITLLDTVPQFKNFYMLDPIRLQTRPLKKPPACLANCPEDDLASEMEEGECPASPESEVPAAASVDEVDSIKPAEKIPTLLGNRLDADERK